MRDSLFVSRSLVFDVRSFRRNSAALLAALLALVSVLILAGCGNEANDAQGAASDDEGRTVRVETLVLSPTSFEDVVQITGAVEALDDATLSAQSAGTVVFLAPLGTYLQAGATVAQLDPALSRSAVEQAEAGVAAAQAEFDLAEDNLNRNEPLYRDSVISAIEWESVRAQYNQARAGLARAKATLSQAREQLSQTRVSAPFSGTVEAHFAEIGEQLTPGREVARVISTSRVKVVAGVPERYAADIRQGTRVRMNFQAYRGQETGGQVSFVGRAIDPDSRTFPIEIVLDNPAGTIKPQMIAQVYVTREEIEDALVIPRAAVLRTEEGNIVYVVKQEGDRAVAERRDVVVGASFGGDVVVTNLQEGDEVIVLGQSNLTEGDRVQVMERHESTNEAGLTSGDTPTAIE